MLTIAYSGTLGYNDSLEFGAPHGFQKLKSYFWTYRHNFHLSKTRSAFNLFQAVQTLAPSYASGQMPLKVLLWGNIDEQYVALAKKLKIDEYIEIGKFYPKEESLEKLSKSDVLFLPIESGAKEHKTLFIPGKAFEYVKMRKPILFDDTESDCSQIIAKSGLGIMTERNNCQSLTSKIKALMENKDFLLEIKPNESYIESLSFKYRAQEIAAIFNSL